jgi:predicted ester cyclase
MATNGGTDRRGEDPGDWIDDGETADTASRAAQSIHEILNERDVSAVDDYHAEDLAYFRSSDDPGSRQDLKDDIQMFLHAFPDLTARVLEVFADDENENLVTVHYEIEGVHKGMFDTIPPTNQHVRTQGIGILEFDGENIVEFSLVFDNLGMYQDLGIVQ